MDVARNRRRTALVAAALFIALALAGCMATRPPVLESGPDAEVTHDGLVRVRGSRFDSMWLKPDADFGRYSRVMMDPVSVAYKRPPRATEGRRSPTSGNFALSDRQLADMKRDFGEAFEQELGKLENFALVQTAGPETLRVEAAIIDLIVNVPTRSSGGDRVFTTSAAQMTLVLELRDSASGEILARGVDHRETQSGSGSVADLRYSTPAANTGALKLLFKRWAQLLASRLDAIHGAPPVAGPADG